MNKTPKTKIFAATTFRTYCLLTISITETNHTMMIIRIGKLIKEARSITSKKHPKTNAHKPATEVDS